jgi:lysozyme
MNLARMEELLILHEDCRLKPYKDTVGKWTIGVGRNISDNGITMREALFLLSNDIDTAVEDARALLDCWDDLDDVRQMVIVDMAFNLGRSRLAEFRRMLAAVEQRRYERAADEMVDSKWYRQVGSRGARLESMMRTGEASGP